MTANGYTLSPKSKSYPALEIFAFKTVDLLTRTAPRDLYDMYNMVKYGLFDESEEDMLRKGERFDLEMTQKEVCKYLASVLTPTEEEEMFLESI